MVSKAADWAIRSVRNRTGGRANQPQNASYSQPTAPSASLDGLPLPFQREAGIRFTFTGRNRQNCRPMKSPLLRCALVLALSLGALNAVYAGSATWSPNPT